MEIYYSLLLIIGFLDLTLSQEQIVDGVSSLGGIDQSQPFFVISISAPNNIQSYTVECSQIEHLDNVIVLSVLCSQSGQYYYDNYNSILKFPRSSIVVPPDCMSNNSYLELYYKGSLTSQNDMTSIKIQIFANLYQNVYCPFQCRNNGRCNSTTGVCDCIENFTGIDCSQVIQLIKIKNQQSLQLQTPFLPINNYISFISIQIQSSDILDSCSMEIITQNQSIMLISATNLRVFNSLTSFDYTTANIAISNLDLKNNILAIKSQNVGSLMLNITCPSTYSAQNSFYIPFLVSVIILSACVILYLLYKYYLYRKNQKRQEQSEQEIVKKGLFDQLEVLRQDKIFEFNFLVASNQNFNDAVCKLCFKSYNPTDSVYITKHLQMFHEECHNNKRRPSHLSQNLTNSYQDTVQQFEQGQEVREKSKNVSEKNIPTNNQMTEGNEDEMLYSNQSKQQND